MTQKRFKLTDIGFVRSNGKSKEIGIITNEGEFIELKKIVEVMNELYEENQTLQQSDTIADLETQIMHLKEENEQLKKKNESMEKTLDKLIQLKETEIKQQRFFIELIEEVLPLDDSIKRGIHQRTIRSNIYD